jgi:AcrR family transcriptional regulator
MSSPLAGRRRQARQNDEVILDAAREVFLDDPKAPIATVAKRAGVGFAALYRRYPAKEDLLRTLCHDGLRRFIAEAEEAAAEPAALTALTGFVERIVDADVHSLTVHLAGTFVPTHEMNADAARATALATALFERARSRLRPGVVVEDLDLVFEACAAIRVPDVARTRQLRRRVLALLLGSLHEADAGDALPGPAPNADELNWRWRM